MFIVIRLVARLPAPVQATVQPVTRDPRESPGGGRALSDTLHAMARAHLLVVVDGPPTLTTLQKALTLEGFAVDVAGGIKVAEEKLKKRTYDLCLFDVMLPDGDGVELLQRMRASRTDTPVIMMSGHATIDTAVRAVRVGALNFLEKPLNTDAMLIAIETALRLTRAEAEAGDLRRAAGLAADFLGDSVPVRRLVEQIERAAR